jgi:type II secretory pathway pseudopilin PulG
MTNDPKPVTRCDNLSLPRDLRHGVGVNTQTRRAPRKNARGLTLIEVLVSAALLGFAVLALARIHTYAIEGLDKSDSVTTAMQLASQRLELLSGESITAALPSCPPLNPGIAGIEEGCLLDPRNLSNPKTCTEWRMGSEVPDTTGSYLQSGTGNGYRVDIVIADHPNQAFYPEAQVAVVSVCWTGAGGDVHEIQARRVFIPGA